VFLLIRILILTLIGVLEGMAVHAQDAPPPVIATGDEQLAEQLAELQAVTFEGYQETQPEQLIGVIQSRESEVSITSQLARYYYENLRANPSTPVAVMKTLSRVQEEHKDELRYFDPQKAVEDSAALLVYLWQNGFHNANVGWRFWHNAENDKNTLTFQIDEGPRAVIDTIILVGLDHIVREARAEVNAAQTTMKSGDPYSESLFEQQLRNVVDALQDHGYYRATYEQPIVKVSEDGLHDSIVVKVTPGPRVRVAEIVMEENTSGYPSVNEPTRVRQLEFREGEWFSRRKLRQSRANLMSLGVFEVVAIDTVSADFVGPDGIPVDSLVAVRVFTKNSKNYDVGANLLLFQTAIDNYLNAGAGINATYQNVFGGAQVASIDLQYILQDISSWFQGVNLQSEALARVQFGWPTLARLDGLRVGLNTNIFYSLRLLIDPFRLESFGIGAQVPVNLYSYTYFNGFDFNISLERQIPLNFEGALDSALFLANSLEDSAYVYSTFSQFLVLDEYLQNTGNFFTGIFAGVNLRGEHRDNPVNPTKGTFASVSTEFGWGAGKFIRLQFFNTAVRPLGRNWIMATKVKVGHIQLLDFKRGSPTDTNTYVPLERQFFAGGAASIRSFPSRLLHDPNSGVIETDDQYTDQVLSNVVGSGSLLELGFEARFTFDRPRGIDDLWASIIERSGFTLFTDIGNAFNRMTQDLYGTMRLEDLWKGSVVAVGIGYRFDTPVGPFRLDYATSLYDPLRSEGQVLWNGRRNVMGLSNWQISIGLGHAF